MESTRLTLRLPAPLAEEAMATAQALGISLNAFLTLATRNWVTYQRRTIGGSAGLQPTTAKAPPAHTVSREERPAKVGRNDPCPCGSGRKWKLCHGKP